MALDAADPDSISDPALRMRYEQARKDFMGVKGMVNLSFSRHFDVDRIFDFIPGLRGNSGKRRIDLSSPRNMRRIFGKFQAVQQELQGADELLGLLDTHIDGPCFYRRQSGAGKDMPWSTWPRRPGEA